MEIILPTTSIAMGLIPSAAMDGSKTCSKKTIVKPASKNLVVQEPDGRNVSI